MHAESREVREVLTTIRLYGKLGSLFGRTFRLNVASPAEAVRALCVQLRGFEAYLANSKVEYAVFNGKRNISVDELADPSGNCDIRIAPFVKGAKKGGILQTIAGVVLVVIGTYAKNPSLVSSGWAMIIGGIVQMLTPMPKAGSPNDKGKNKASTQFSGPVNTQAQGNAVGVCYGGPLIIGSAVISAGIQANDNAYVPLNTDEEIYGGGSSNWVKDYVV
jgi:predicted phage tail protein